MTKIVEREVETCGGLNPCPYHNGFAGCLCEKTNKYITNNKDGIAHCVDGIPSWCPLEEKKHG